MEPAWTEDKVREAGLCHRIRWRAPGTRQLPPSGPLDAVWANTGTGFSCPGPIGPKPFFGGIQHRMIGVAPDLSRKRPRWVSSWEDARNTRVARACGYVARGNASPARPAPLSPKLAACKSLKQKRLILALRTRAG